jgi:hypothetical protein
VSAKEACDDCLTTNADAVGSDSHAPAALVPGDYVSFDVYSLGVKHVHGGQSKVFGAHDLYSKRDFVMLMNNESESEVLRCLKAYNTFCKAENVSVKHLHTDNYASYLTPAVRSFVQNEMGAVYTQSPPETPRSNGTSERQWRTMGNDARRLLQHARLPRNFAWYALRHAVEVRNTLPWKDDPTMCAYKAFTGRAPNVMGYRVWGCVVYAKVMHPLTKMANQAVRCVHLGRATSGPGYICYDPSTQKAHISIHCRFVERSTPGFTVNSQGGWLECVPDYADEFDCDADIVDGLGNPIGALPDATISDVDEPLIPAEGAPDAAAQPAASPASPPPSSRTRSARPTAQSVASPQPSARAVGAPPRAPPGVNERPTRPQRSRGLNIYQSRGARPSMAAVALLSMSNLVAALQPGGDTFGTQFIGLGDNARSNYFLYLCSGPARPGDFEHHIKQLSGAEIYVVNIDSERGGHSHDMSTTVVADRVCDLASKHECLGVLCTIPCSTWSAARMAGDSGDGGPCSVRNATYPSGIPDVNGVVPLRVLKANSIADNCLQCCEAVMSHGGHVIVENPVHRGAGSQFAIPGREQHSSLWQYPPMVAFSQKHDMRVTVFDQCRCGADSMKTTQLLSSPSRCTTSMCTVAWRLSCATTHTGSTPSCLAQRARGESLEPKRQSSSLRRSTKRWPSQCFR